jgi:hypothetical protein
MLLIGKNITQINDLLTPVTVEKVYKALINERGEVAMHQKRLQILRSIDINQYRKLKTGLPYIVCAHSHPNIRQKENFSYTERFLVDIDHLAEYGLDIQEIKEKLKADRRVELLFISPSGNGLKVMFKLEKKITDAGYFSMFYKAFCMQFAEIYGLGAAVDLKTSDVSRCCFVSYDSQAFYNENVDQVIASDYLAPNNFERLDDLLSELKVAENNIKEENEAFLKDWPRNNQKELGDDVLNAIKIKVGQKINKTTPKYYEQPEFLQELMPRVQQLIEDAGALIQKNIPISYGRQITIIAERHWAELNIFYGKKGVSVVASTKTGSNKQLCEMMLELLKSNL